MQRDLVDQLRHLLRPLATRVSNMVARGVVQLVNDGTKMQLMQLGVLAGETVEGDKGAEHFQQYGFSSVPPVGAEAVIVFPNGDRSHPLVVATSDRGSRPTGSEPGEVVIYNNAGAKIALTKDGDIVIQAAPGRQILMGDGSGTLTALDGVVTGKAIDSFTGATEFSLGKTSATVWVKK